MNNTTLHTIRSSIQDKVWLYEQLAYSSNNDSILLIQDAVLSTHSPISLASFVEKCRVNDVQVFVLIDDCQARGVFNKYPLISEVDYAGFVSLIIEHDKHVAW